MRYGAITRRIDEGKSDSRGLDQGNSDSLYPPVVEGETSMRQGVTRHEVNQQTNTSLKRRLFWDGLCVSAQKESG